MGLLNISLPWHMQAQEERAIISWRECSKKSVQQGRSHFDARSVQGVREHGKMATCLREAAPAKAGNAAGGFFQHSHIGLSTTHKGYHRSSLPEQRIAQQHSQLCENLIHCVYSIMISLEPLGSLSPLPLCLLFQPTRSFSIFFSEDQSYDRAATG